MIKLSDVKAQYRIRVRDRLMVLEHASGLTVDAGQQRLSGGWHSRCRSLLVALIGPPSGAIGVIETAGREWSRAAAVRSCARR
jgi:hypothetical protein